MPQIQIEFDVGDKVYVVTGAGSPREVVETSILGCFIEKTPSVTRISYRVFGLTQEVCDDRVFKDPWSAFNPDAPTAQD